MLRMTHIQKQESIFDKKNSINSNWIVSAYCKVDFKCSICNDLRNFFLLLNNLREIRLGTIRKKEFILEYKNSSAIDDSQ